MSTSRTSFLLCLICLIALAAPAAAQPPASDQTRQPDEKTFDLLRPSEQARMIDEEEEREAYLPRIEPGKVEIALTLGFLDLNQTLLSHEQIVYKYNDESTFWGDVEIKGTSAFHPVARLGYNLTRFFALEAAFSFASCKYAASVENRVRRPNTDPNAPPVYDPPLGEFDAENGSVIALGGSLAGVLYPLALGDSEGRFHPYLTGGFGRMWYEMNSRYVDGLAGASDAFAGAGIRLIADDLISVRLEFSVHRSDLQWTPAEFFEQRDDGTVRIPLTEFPGDDVVTELESQSLTSFAWGIGFIATF
ncbi:MAG: hypothetical protein R6X25_13055 [Candidatus Krumholzibacteriia bacterium]